MKRILKTFWIDLRASKLLFLLPIGATLIIYAATLFLMNALPEEMKAWRFGYLGQEFLLILYILWTMLVMQRWFDPDEAEGLRSSEIHHSSTGALLLSLIFECLVLMHGVFLGFLFQVNFFWEVVRILVFQVFLSSLVYIMTLLFRNVFFSSILVMAYCLFCSIFGGKTSLNSFCLIRPGVGGAVSLSSVLTLWPYMGVAVFVFVIADRLEQRMTWIR